MKKRHWLLGFAMVGAAAGPLWRPGVGNRPSDGVSWSDLAELLLFPALIVPVDLRIRSLASPLRQVNRVVYAVGAAVLVGFGSSAAVAGLLRLELCPRSLVPVACGAGLAVGLGLSALLERTRSPHAPSPPLAAERQR